MATTGKTGSHRMVYLMMSLILSDGTAFHVASVTDPLPQVLPVPDGMLSDAHALD